ncbi:MAG: PQQ-binding-like beta-propeller repeat protein [Ferruginibacter sp.]
MKNVMLFLCLLIAPNIAKTQFKSFRFAFISDTHINVDNSVPSEDLRRTVADINAMSDVAFVVITGDITEMGTNEELKMAKKILDSLHIPWYIIPGNHDTGWSESGGVMFSTVFGDDKFNFEYEGIRFIGCASGPYVRMSDGHVPRSAVNWLDEALKKLRPNQPLIFLNHYPINNQLDNWYEITNRVRKHNTWAILCGHGHANNTLDFEDIPGVMGRSNLRAKAESGGYNLVDVTSDSMIFLERRPGKETLKSWAGVKIETKYYDEQKQFTRPDYSINKKYSQVKAQWKYSSGANIISTPAVTNDRIIVGNQNGEVVCFALKDGKQKWSFSTGAAIFSSPAVSQGKVVLGVGNGDIYCVDARSGKQLWKIATGVAVLGSPIITGDTVFMAGYYHSFVSLNLRDGKVLWKFSGIDGPVVSTPVNYNGMIIFGAWDRNLYALNSSTGALLWSWNNGSPVRMYSPAACIPVVADGVVYIVAPDRYITAIDASTGTTLWRNNDATIRESIGISASGKWIYGKTMQDTVVAYTASRDKQSTAWKMNCGFGYEHVPSMLIEKDGLVFFGTKSGVVYCIDPAKQKVLWAHKIDNSMVNTVRVLNKNTVVATTMDGKLVVLKNSSN